MKVVRWIVLAVMVLSAAVWVAPRVYVKNRHAHLVYDGKVSAKVRVFHGSRGRLAIIMDEPKEIGLVYMLEPGDFPREVEQCGPADFVNLKLLLLQKSSGTCHFSSDAAANGFSISFTTKSGVPVTVSWEAALR
jgi:hypothetical protein